MTRAVKRRQTDKGKAAARSAAARDVKLTFYYVDGKTVDDPTIGVADLLDNPEVGEHKTYEVPPTLHQSSSTNDLNKVLTELRHLFCPSLVPELINTHFRYRDIAGILSLGNFRRLLSALEKMCKCLSGILP